MMNEVMEKTYAQGSQQSGQHEVMTGDCVVSTGWNMKLPTSE